MQTTKLYRYVVGYTTVTTSKRPKQPGYKTIYYLTADEGKVLVNGDQRTTHVETFKPKDWTEEDE